MAGEKMKPLCLPRFLGVIRRASEQAGRGVVVLVDEYDKPLLQAIQNEPLLNSYRSTLKAFYGVLKSADRYLRFCFSDRCHQILASRCV